LFRQAANDLGGNQLQRFGFCIGSTSIWWEMFFLTINPVWFGFTRETVWFGL
jgi:hypothetical protein